jgi:sugar lactone lactonase YvrE
MKRLRPSLTFVLALCTAYLLLSGTLLAQNVTTTAGGYVGDNGSATNAAVSAPSGLLRDSVGNTYVSDFYGQRIRKITSSGTISTYAGNGKGGYNGDGLLATQAEIFYTAGMTFDLSGNIVFADGGNSRVRKIDKSTRIVTTIAGDGTFGYTGDGGPATSAELGQPWGLMYDSAGNLYIADVAENVVRVVNTSGVIHTFAGTGVAGYSGDGGPATSAEIYGPSGLAIDSSSNIYIADRFNHRVRKVDAHGKISTFAGNGTTGAGGDGGPATSASIGNCKGLAIRSGVLYISNGGKSRVRSVAISTGIINTYAGSTTGYDGDGLPLTSSMFFSPSGLLFDSSGNLFLADQLNGRVRKAVSGNMTTFAGGYLGDTKGALSAAFYFPEAIAFDSSNNYYVADYTSNRVRMISAAGTITTVAGNGTSGYSGDGGPATSAQLYLPTGVVADGSLNIYISDSANNVIRKVDHASGTISTFATYANWSTLGALALSADGKSGYVVDQSTCAAYQVDGQGNVTLIAGVEFVCGYNGDNISAVTAQLNTPYGIAVDSSNNIYIADSSNNRIRKVNTSTGIITTYAGNGTCGFSGDGGPPTSAELCFPEDLVLNNGIAYIADTSNLRIRKVQNTIISTWAGTGIAGYNGDGLPALSTNFDDPVAITKNTFGTIFMVDDVQSRVRKIK